MIEFDTQIIPEGGPWPFLFARSCAAAKVRKILYVTKGQAGGQRAHREVVREPQERVAARANERSAPIELRRLISQHVDLLMFTKK